MKVIMLKDVRGVGQKGKVVEVSDGYGLNYLVANGFAVQATAEKEAEVKKRFADEAARNASRDKAIAEKVRALEGKKVVIKAKANDHGHLFKKIKRDDVAEALANTGGFIDPSMIKDFGDSVQDVGEHVIHIVGAGAEAAVTVVIEALN